MKSSRDSKVCIKPETIILVRNVGGKSPDNQRRAHATTKVATLPRCYPTCLERSALPLFLLGHQSCGALAARYFYQLPKLYSVLCTITGASLHLIIVLLVYRKSSYTSIPTSCVTVQISVKLSRSRLPSQQSYGRTLNSERTAKKTLTASV